MRLLSYFLPILVAAAQDTTTLAPSQSPTFAPTQAPTIEFNWFEASSNCQCFCDSNSILTSDDGLQSFICVCYC
jgi:hypothetical protein